jgi:hypothetical protein
MSYIFPKLELINHLCRLSKAVTLIYKLGRFPELVHDFLIHLNFPLEFITGN